MKKLLVCLILVLLPSFAIAANHAIQPGCTYSGDGSNWACAASPGASGAWNAIPATLTRGDTYYFGDGTITQSYLLDDANSGTTYIYFKKATAADYGGLSNWSASYGDGQTVFNSNDSVYCSIFQYAYGSSNGYYSIDGVKGAGSFNTADYGFYFVKNIASTYQDAALIFNGQNGYAPYQIVKNSAFNGNGSLANACTKLVSSGGYGLIQGCYFTNADNPVWAMQGGATVDNCIFINMTVSTSGCHGQYVSSQASDITVKNSYFEGGNQCGAMIADPNQSVHTTDNWLIYNNVFVNNVCGEGIWARSDPVDAVVSNFKIYSNTIYGGNGKLGSRFTSGGTGNEFKNNLIYGASYGLLYDSVGGDFGGAVWTFSNNYHNSTSTFTGSPTDSNAQTETIGATSLFTDPANKIFTLKSGVSTVAINNGATLGSPYNVDRAGNTRTAPYDMGAYEYGSSAPPGDNPMTVSAGADRATNTASETVTGTVADDDGVASVSWSNARGGSGACTGTTSFSCGSITMANGINSITITALDNLGNSGSDSVDLTYYVSVSNGSVVTVTMPQLIYFKAASAGNYKLTGSVNASGDGTNSFFIDVSTDPINSATKQWHLDYPTTDYDEQDVRWGTWDNPDAYQSPTIWALSGANQILYIREREAGTLIESVKFVSMSADETAPAVTIATSSPQSVTSDALTVTGTATDAVWGTGSVCKFRIGAEPDADNGTACTGTTSWSCAATGFALGANTLYIECGDAVPNWSTGHSITVNYGTPTPLPAVTMRGIGLMTGGTLK